MVTVTPGTPNCLRSCSTRCSKPAGGAAPAPAAAIINATPVNARRVGLSINSLLDGNGIEGLRATRVPQLPHADGDERKDEGREQDVGERAVAGGDQRDEAEAAGEE